ncbi:uncharacterized protein [Mytilus edulis]|uniref:uncharacterized protein n=1 Tax=Mytilus edulis TaxID=6550 RepID=UPI0039F0E11C
MQHIQKLECESQHLVTNIVNTLSSKYNSVSPQEFHLQHRFSEELPDCEFTGYQESLRQIKLKTLKKGEQQGTSNDRMIVKQKIATAASDVSFGWYKMHPWQQKKWTFFLKNSNILTLS